MDIISNLISIVLIIVIFCILCYVYLKMYLNKVKPNDLYNQQQNPASCHDDLDDDDMIVGSKYCDDIDPDSFIRYNDLKYYPIFDNDEKVVYIQISNQKIPIRKYNGEYFVYIDNVVYNFKKPKRAFNQIDTIDRLTDNTSLDSALKREKKVKENEDTKKRIAKIEKEIEKRIMKKMKKKIKNLASQRKLINLKERVENLKEKVKNLKERLKILIKTNIILVMENKKLTQLSKKAMTKLIRC